MKDTSTNPINSASTNPTKDASVNLNDDRSSQLTVTERVTDHVSRDPPPSSTIESAAPVELDVNLSRSALAL
jgi:hypothetical protein